MPPDTTGPKPERERPAPPDPDGAANAGDAGEAPTPLTGPPFSPAEGVTEEEMERSGLE